MAAAGTIIDGEGGRDFLRRGGGGPVVLTVVLRVLLALPVTLGRVTLLVALVPVRLLLALLVGLLRVAGRRSLLSRHLLRRYLVRRLLPPLLFPVLTLLIPDPLSIAGGVVGLRRVAGVRARIALTLVTRPRVTLVGRAVLAVS